MTIRELLLSEFDDEMASTRRMFEALPPEHFSWRPHPKSKTLLELANHVARLPVFVAVLINGQAGKPGDAMTKPELLAALDRNVAAGREALAETTDEHLTAVIMPPPNTMPRVMVLRRRVINHLIHHRAQLGDSLRLLDVPVPGMYGPTADEPH